MKDHITAERYSALIKQAIETKFSDDSELLYMFTNSYSDFLLHAFNLFAEALLEEAAENAAEYIPDHEPLLDSIKNTRLI